MKLLRYLPLLLVMGQAKPARDFREVRDMAEHRWVSSSGDVAAAASWSSGVAPSGWASTDTVLFNGSSATAPTTNLNQSAIVIARLTVTTEETLNIGSSGSPLRFNLAASAGSFKGLLYRGTGAMHFGGAGTSDVYVDSTNIVDALTLYNTVGNIYVNAGTVTITSGATCTGSAFVNGISASLIYSGGTTGLHMNVSLDSGYIYNSRVNPISGSPVWRIGGGIWEQAAIQPAEFQTPTLYLTGGIFRSLESAPTRLGYNNAYLLGGTVDYRNSLFEFSVTTELVIGPNVVLLRGAIPFDLVGTGLTLDAREPYLP